MILMAGDSWGCGELSEGNREMPQHPGLVEYFHQDGVGVINICQLGGSNHESTESIKFFLRFNPHFSKKITSILVWQTEWVRDSKAYAQDQLHQELTLGYQTLRSRWISRFYYRLCDLYQEFQIPVYVIGGCSDADWFPDFEKEYPGVKVACQSVVNLLLNQDHTIQDPVFWELLLNREFAERLRQYNKDQDLLELTNDMEKGLGRLRTLEKNPGFFWPDGYHPNRKSLRVLYDFLIKTHPFLLGKEPIDQ